MNNSNIVSAIFDDRSEAERAVSALRDAGVDTSAISVIGQHDGRTTTTDGDGVADNDGGSVLRGILGGGALGAGLGVAALAIPGVGPLVGLGAIAASAVPGAMATGAAIGAAAGGLGEVLADHGVDEADSRYYEERIHSGGIFVSVDTSRGGASPDTVRDIMYRAGGHNSRQSRMTTTASAY